MDRTWLMLIVVVAGLALLALMVVGWRARRARQRDIPAPAGAPLEPGEPLGAFDGRYLATTSAGDRLDRIAVHGLGFRSGVVARVSTTGVLLERTGEPDVWIPRDDVIAHHRASWTIDRGVEPDGLSVIEWRLGARALDTALRLNDPQGFDHALTSLATTGRTAS